MSHLVTLAMHTAHGVKYVQTRLLRLLFALVLVHTPTLALAEPKFADPLPRNAISEVASLHQMKMSACYMLGTSDNNAGPYRVTIGFDVRPNGKIKGLQVIKATHKLPFVESCLLQEMARWQFPKPHGGRPVRVIYPMTFYNPSDALAVR